MRDFYTLENLTYKLKILLTEPNTCHEGAWDACCRLLPEQRIMGSYVAEVNRC